MSETEETNEEEDQGSQQDLLEMRQESVSETR